MAKKINSFGISNLLVASHYEFHRTTDSSITAATPAALLVDDLAPQYKAEVKTLFALVNRATGSALSKQIAELDKERDGLLSELFSIVDAAAASRLETRNKPGAELKRIIAPYRGIAANEYTKETGQIRGLIRDLSPDPVFDLCETLAITPLVDNLTLANNKLAELMDDRSNEAGTRAAVNHVNTDEQRKLVDTIYRQIVEKVNAVAILQPTPAVETFIDKQNGTIIQYKNVLAHQRAGGTGTEAREPRDPSSAEAAAPSSPADEAPIPPVE